MEHALNADQMHRPEHVRHVHWKANVLNVIQALLKIMRVFALPTPILPKIQLGDLLEPILDLPVFS